MMVHALLTPLLSLLAGLPNLMTAFRSCYTAVMMYLKPIQDLIASEQFTSPGASIQLQHLFTVSLTLPGPCTRCACTARLQYTSTCLRHTAEFMKEELKRLIKSQPTPPGINATGASWFSEDPDTLVKDMPSAKENHAVQMSTHAYNRFWSVPMLAVTAERG